MRLNCKWIALAGQPYQLEEIHSAFYFSFLPQRPKRADIPLRSHGYLRKAFYCFTIGARCGDMIRRLFRSASSWLYPTIPPWRFNTLVSCPSVSSVNNLLNGISAWLLYNKIPSCSSAFICAALAGCSGGDCARWSTLHCIPTLWGCFPGPQSGKRGWAATGCALAWVLYHKSRSISSSFSSRSCGMIFSEYQDWMSS